MEKWKFVEGTGGKYQVSNFGRFKRSYYDGVDSIGRPFCRKELIIKQKTAKAKRPFVNNKSGTYYIDVEVARAFCGYEGRHFLHFLDGNTMNTKAENIVIGTPESISTDKEEWRYIKGYGNNYIVSNRGNVASVFDVFRPLKNGRGHIYPRVNLSHSSGKLIRNYIHQLVAEHFIGKKDGLFVLHKDDNPLNNDVSNLYYGTQLQNIKDCYRNGNAIHGDKSHFAKITNADVKKIRETKMPVYEIQNTYGLSKVQAKRIINKTSWKHI